MTTASNFPKYLQLMEQGPFPVRVDPWAEDPRYFHQIHGSMIEAIVGQIRDALLERRYLFTRQESLQMVTSYPLDALHITQNGELVTAIEIVSPDSKTDALVMSDYVMHRNHSYINRQVNLVEIDLTRSENRLLQHPVTESCPYHIAIHLPGHAPRLLTMEFHKPLMRFALPLGNEVIAVELQQAYTDAYQRYAIAAQIQQAQQYTEDHLPCPAWLTELQRREILEDVQRWQDELKRWEGA